MRSCLLEGMYSSQWQSAKATVTLIVSGNLLLVKATGPTNKVRLALLKDCAGSTRRMEMEG